MKSFVILSALSTAVWAQSSTSNPLIPTGISSNCSAFLTTLDSDATLAQCIQPIITASSQFGPSSNSSTASAATISSALNNLCSSSSTGSCSDSTVRNQLANFYTACTPELTGSSPNADVIRTYDVLYALTPLQDAVCSKDDSGNYCATQINTNTTSSTSASPSSSASSSKELVTTSQQSQIDLVLNNLWTTSSAALTRRTTTVQNATAALIPNTTTYRNSNLVFLFLNPSMPSSTLCVSCTRSIMTAYVTFESSVPYAPGISSSPLMGGQSALYQAIQNTCGANFMSNAVQAAGGISSGVAGTNGAQRTAGGEFGYAGALLAAIALGFVAVM